MTVAALDIGSNSVRMLVVGDHGDEIIRDASVTGLATSLGARGRFDARAYAATLETIARYRQMFVDLGVQVVNAIATSASRDATNGDDLMDDIAAILGVRPRIVDGATEAAYAFAGATAAAPEGDSKLVIDIGGGSTEFVHGCVAPDVAISVDIGSVRLTDRCIARRPIPRSVVDEARAIADTAFRDVIMPTDTDIAIGVAGTFTNLSAMAMHLDAYDRTLVHGSVLTLGEIGELVARLASLTVEETAAIPSLDPARARVIFAGAVIAERAMRHTGLSDIIVSERDLLDGLVIEILDGSGGVELSDTRI